MKIGDTIGDYKLTTNGSSAGGGRSMWAFGVRDGKPYFIKQFLSPKYPVEGAPGSSKTKSAALERCRLFEKRQTEIMGALSGKVSSGGSLVAPVGFVRLGTTYFKIYDKIDIAALSSGDIARLSESDKLLIMQVVAHSVDILHKFNIVHGDLKPDNVLIKRTDGGAFTAKVIDFDDSYFAGSPPDSESVVGDAAYYSPELLKYIVSGDESLARTIGLKSDIFALGLIFCQIMAARFPTTEGKSAAAFINEGGEIKVADFKLSAPLAALMNEMLAREPSLRPDAESVRDRLKTMRRLADPGGAFAPASSTPSAGAAAPAATGGRVLIKRRDASPAAPSASPAPPPSSAPPAPPVSRLKIKPRKT